MNINKLEANKIYKNYKKLCNVLNVNVKGGKSKQLQIIDMKRYFKYHNEGNKFIIDEIYPEPKEKIKINIDNRGKSEGSRNNNRKEFPNFLISLEDEVKIGVYKITLDKDVYIGSTISSFRHRFIQHNFKNNPIPNIFNMLKNEATFEIVEICEEMTEPEIRELENKYINEYKNNNKWNLINSNDAWSYIPESKIKN